MPLRNAIPVSFRARSLCDTIDATNTTPGAMLSLSNLIPSPSTQSMFVPRPAAKKVSSFAPYNTPAAVSALLVIGTRAYGMLSSSDQPGHDVPFCFDLAGSNFVAIAGITSANTPATQPTSGDWQPPHMEMIGTRILVTHPGFAGGTAPFFGWLDMTSYQLNSLVGNTTAGSPIIQSISGDGGSTPILDGVQPGQTISGPGIPANSRVVSVVNGTFDKSTTGDTHTTTVIDNIPSTAGMLAGMYVTGAGIANGTVIASVDSAVQITLSAAATASTPATPIQVIGGGTITIDHNATATANRVALAIAGGSFGAPLWCAGNTNGNPLPAVPAWVSNFNGRAYFAVKNAEVFSDVLFPLQVTNAIQALILGDTTDVTCAAGLPLTNQVVGGIIQSLIVFKGAGPMFQIAGDAALGTLSINVIQGSVGTLAPNSITPTTRGVAYVAPDGLRFIDLQANVSDPLGTNGEGVAMPFIFAISPSRTVAAFNQNVLRISVKDGLDPNQTSFEYWLDFNLDIWSGPHTFPAGLIQAYRAPTSASAGLGFVLAPIGLLNSLWTSDVIALGNAEFVENGTPLTWTWQTSLLPDNAQMSMNAIVQSALAAVLAPNQTITIEALDETGTVLDTVTLTGPSLSGPLWGSFKWGQAKWGLPSGVFQQSRLKWTKPLVFKQMSILITGQSAASMAIGNLYMRYQPLGYLLPAA